MLVNLVPLSIQVYEPNYCRTNILVSREIKNIKFRLHPQQHFYFLYIKIIFVYTVF